jgi:hypothetical protein
MERILETDDYITMAQKIYETFDVHHSCTIKGLVLDRDKEVYIPKGELVLEQINRLDIAENYDKFGRRRRRVKPVNSIGDYVAGKIFKYEQRIKDKKVIYLIWRVQ